MKYKLLLFALSAYLFAGAQTEVTIFDPATYSGSDGVLDSIDGTKYLKLETIDDYPAFTFDEATDVSEADSIVISAVYAVHDGGEVIENINLWLKVGNSGYGDVAIATGPASETPASYTAIPVAGAEPAALFQWRADGLAGDTLWLGKIVAYIPPKTPVNDFTIENVVVGSVDSPEDFSAMLNMSYDADSIYMEFVITDDSIVNAGAAYQVDNIEIYLDLDNSKNIHFPRNEGWQQTVDEAYDSLDFQFRLVPDSAFSVNNGSRPSLEKIGGVKQVYMETDTGYVFNLHIMWDSLSMDFDPEGDTIGFDVLISDNDAVASDANRNQITWNSPTDKPYNDPSLFGTLELSGGGFFVILDEEPPTAPGNLAGTDEDGKAGLSWDAADDNIAVLKYIISQDGTEIATVYGVEGSNTYTVNGLDEGSYEFSVVAVDNSGNESSAATVEVDVTVSEVSVDPVLTNQISVYPNPVNSTLNISGVENISHIEIVGITGQVVATFENSSSINLSDLNSGIYIVKVYAENEIHTARIRKN